MWLRRAVPWVKRTGRGGRDIVLRKPERGVRKDNSTKNFAGRWLGLLTSAAVGRAESIAEQQSNSRNFIGTYY